MKSSAPKSENLITLPMAKLFGFQVFRHEDLKAHVHNFIKTGAFMLKS